MNVPSDISESLPTWDLSDLYKGINDPQLSSDMEEIERLAQKFSDVGADAAEKIITYCGGGIAASNDAFILSMLGYENVAVYDASMSEWASDPSLPMQTG